MMEVCLPLVPTLMVFALFILFWMMVLASFRSHILHFERRDMRWSDLFFWEPKTNGNHR